MAFCSASSKDICVSAPHDPSCAMVSTLMCPVIDNAGVPSTVQQSIPSNAGRLAIKLFIEFHSAMMGSGRLSWMR
jgi:hypothetical protein